jgi:hypothetical protein
MYPAALKEMREQQVAFKLAHALLDKHYRDPVGNPRPWLFPSVLSIVRDWMNQAVEYKCGEI